MPTQIKIDPGRYTGSYTFYDDNALIGTFRDAQSFWVAEGAVCRVDNGARIGGSSFTFTVDEKGKIRDIAPSGAARTADKGRTLVFRTSAVRIDTGRYGGWYEPTFTPGERLRGTQAFRLIRGLTYDLQVGSRQPVPPSTGVVRFTLSESGRLLARSIAPEPAGRRVGAGETQGLRLRSRRLYVGTIPKPDETPTFSVSSFYEDDAVTKTRFSGSVVLRTVRGLHVSVVPDGAVNEVLVGTDTDIDALDDD